MTFHAKPTPKGALWKQMPQYASKTIEAPKKHIHGSKKTLAARKPVRQVSHSMKKRLVEYGKAKRLFLHDHPWCQECFTSKATDLHHRKGRLGKLLTDPMYFMALCRTCHRFYHENVSLGYARGVHLKR